MATATVNSVALADCKTANEVFALLGQGKCTLPEAQKRIEEFVSSAAQKSGTLSLKISDKGCVCLSGLNGKWPVSLYANQWERLLGHREQIEAFIAANRIELDKLSAAAKLAKDAAKNNPAQ
jgi:hypothetical protein